MAVERVRQMTIEEFLDFAEASEYRYEYINGEPVKMTGGKLNHFRIIKAILVQLENRLLGTQCETLPNGMLVRVGRSTLICPDVSVVCGEAETEADTRILLNPILVVEVTSPSSIHHDRVVKREFYQSVPSIQAYLIVDQHQVFAELYSRVDASWQLQTFSRPEDDIPLAALNCRLPLRDIYRNIALEEA